MNAIYCYCTTKTTQIANKFTKQAEDCCARVSSTNSIAKRIFRFSLKYPFRNRGSFMGFIACRSLDQVSILCQLSSMAFIINTGTDTNSLQTVSIFKQKCKFFYPGQPRPLILPRPSPIPAQAVDSVSGVRFDTFTYPEKRGGRGGFEDYDQIFGS